VDKAARIARTTDLNIIVAGETSLRVRKGFKTCGENQDRATIDLFGLQKDLCQGFNGVTQGLANLGYQQQSCCCEINRNIDAVRAEAFKNTCEITNAIHAEGEATRALMTQNTIQELRDELQAAQLQLGNLSQTANIIGALRPFPQPAYITCSPYQAHPVYNGCGNCCA
jgi:hypothetical protein